MAYAAHIQLILRDADGSNVRTVGTHAQAVVQNLLAAAPVRRLERALGVLLPRVNFPTAKAVVALAVHAQGVT